MKKVLCLFVSAALIVLVGLAGVAFANDVAVQSVSLTNVNPGAGTADVSFQLKQDNAWGSSGTPLGNGAYDVVWIFVKYSTEEGADGTWRHAKVSGAGAKADGRGAFLDVANNSGAGSWEDKTLTWQFGDQGVLTSASARMKVCAIEMVRIPDGAFYYNVGGIGGSNYNNYGDGVETEVTSAAQVPSGASTGWPNGYSAFCIAKHEVSQGQYADFLTTISDAESDARYYNTSSCGQTITRTVTEGNSTYSAGMPNRGMNYLSWDDARAYASWCGLRPMTEMEFEKAGRGASAHGPESGKATYPWGNEAPSTTTGAIEGGTHIIYHANYHVSGISYKPIQVGWYLSQSYTNDDYTGASIYGVTDLAGNNWEHLINCQGTDTPANGNGTVDYSGLNWPAASSGKGFRGGGWDLSSWELRGSDRSTDGWTYTGRKGYVGFRPAGTLD